MEQITNRAKCKNTEIQTRQNTKGQNTNSKNTNVKNTNATKLEWN